MPSLYESTVNTGEVSSSNFTTLYNASGLSVPNAGAGSVTGNLNVGGNLTVQGSSLLIGEVTLQSTLSLPNYTFPLPDGSTDQVLVTDGNGNLYWTDVSAIPGADYSISATTVSGGANLTLENTAGFTDSVKFAAGTNMSIVRTDANTITISTVADNIPDGTAQGQVLYWNGSAWTASSNIASSASNNRLVVQYNNSTAGANNALFLRKNFGSTAYSESTNDGVATNYSLTSDSQGISSYGSTVFEYSATDPQFVVQSSTDNFATSTNLLLLQKSLAGFYAPNLILNASQTGSPTLNATITAERGSSTNATITWDETDDRWESNFDFLATGLQGGNIQIAMAGLGENEIYIGSSQDLLLNTGGGLNNIQSNSPIKTSAESMTINSDSTVNDSYLYMKGNTEYLQWNNADSRFEFSDQIYNSQTDIPAILERRITTATTVDNESRTSLRLTARVTDAANNETLSTGPALNFSRTSGASDPTEKLFAGLATVWDGTNNKATLFFNWTNDNYTEPSPGVFPETYNMLNLSSENAKFFNNSLYVDYTVVTNTETATSITGGNTLVFGSAHGYTAGQRILFQSATQNGLKLSSYYYVSATGLTTTQCQVSLTSGGSSVALTNGTGLTLTFAEVTNQVGINTDTPAYTLDVNGTTNTVGQLSLPSMISNTADPIYAIRSIATTNAGVRALSLRAESTGTPTVGFGTLLDFEVETSATNTERAGYIGVTSTDVTAGSEDFVMDFGLMQNGAGYLSKMTLDSEGDLQIDGDLTVSGTNINTGITDQRIQIDRTTATTNLSRNALALQTTSTGTPAVGMGTALAFNVQTQVSNIEEAGFIAVNSTDITSGSENFEMRFGLIQNGAAYDTKMILDSEGNLDIDGQLDASSIEIDNQATINTATLTTTSTATVPLTTSTRNAITGLVNIIQGANVHCVNFTALRVDATTAMLTTYGEMYNTTSLASFTADVSGGAVRLLITPTSATSTVFSVVRTTLT